MAQLTISEALQLAHREHEADRFDRAEQVYRKILAADPQQPDALQGLGMLAARVGQYKLAKNLMREALQAQPDSAIMWSNWGNFLLSQKNYSQATIAYQKALDINPKSIVAYQKLGYTWQQLEKFDRASSCFQKAMEVKYSSVAVRQASPYDNIYHCCVQKTASQWFRSIFNDRLFYEYTGLVTCPYVRPGLKDEQFHRAWPTQTVATHLYISYPTYLTLPKPQRYKTFFIARDPRDIVVSFYFSTKYSHSLVSYIPQMRKDLEQLSLREGLKYSIDRLEDMGLFSALKSWFEVEEKPSHVRIFHYENLAKDNESFLKTLFDYLNLQLPEPQFSQLCERHQFKRYTQGRERGEEDINSHYRKGEAGDWKNYFDESLATYLKQVTNDAIAQLGYPE